MVFVSPELRRVVNYMVVVGWSSTSRCWATGRTESLISENSMFCSRAKALDSQRWELSTKLLNGLDWSNSGVVEFCYYFRSNNSAKPTD